MKETDIPAENDIQDNRTGVEIENKRLVQIILIAGFLAVMFMVLCGLEDAGVKTVTVSVSESTAEFEFNIGETEFYKSLFGEAFVVRNAYIFVPDESIGQFDVRMILRDTATGKCLEIPTVSTPDGLIPKKYDDETNNLERAAFTASVMTRELNLENTDYDIIIYYNTNGRNDYYFTGYRLTEGGLSY